MQVAPLKVNVEKSQSVRAGNQARSGAHSIFMDILSSQTGHTLNANEGKKAEEILLREGLIEKGNHANSSSPLIAKNTDLGIFHKKISKLSPTLPDLIGKHKSVNDDSDQDIASVLPLRTSKKMPFSQDSRKPQKDQDNIAKLMAKDSSAQDYVETLMKTAPLARAMNQNRALELKGQGFSDDEREFPEIGQNSLDKQENGKTLLNTAIKKISANQEYVKNLDERDSSFIRINSDNDSSYDKLANDFVEVENQQEFFPMNHASGPTALLHKQDGIQVVSFDNLNVSDTSRLIDQISNYISENSIKNNGSLDLVVNHKELGNFKIHVNHVGNSDTLDIEIKTITNRGHDFFAQNEKSLMRTLTDSGLRISDFKITTGNEFGNMTNDGHSSGREYYSTHRTTQFVHDQNRQDQGDADSQRRKMLWEMYRMRSQA